MIGVREVRQSSRVEVSEGGEEAQATLLTESKETYIDEDRGRHSSVVI